MILRFWKPVLMGAMLAVIYAAGFRNGAHWEPDDRIIVRIPCPYGEIGCSFVREAVHAAAARALEHEEKLAAQCQDEAGGWGI